MAGDIFGEIGCAAAFGEKRTDFFSAQGQIDGFLRRGIACDGNAVFSS